MRKVIADMSVSLDGFVGLPDGEDPGLHRWVFDGTVPLPLAGTTYHLTSERSAELFRERVEGAGAVIVGGGTFKGFGEEAIFQLPTFVLTHAPRESVVKRGVPITFICDGIESALRQAQFVARDKAVYVFGVATTVQQYIRAGLLDEIQVNVVPMLIGDGLPLFDRIGMRPIDLKCTRVVAAAGVTHMQYRFMK
ncbi:MAG: dihydrofolate reductase family protein [Anaerolineae bacterium]|nr:dihydrofolate reductase family protein [Anaerolineae bacterium]